MAEDLYIVFDGPPSHESGRFVEVEIACGKSVRAGKWEEYPGKPGLWRLGPFTVPTPSPSAAHAEVQQGYSADDLPCEKHGATICEPCAYDRGFAAGRAASPSPDLLDLVAKSAAAKNDAYAQRNRLVAALSKVFPAHECRHPDSDTDWEDDWRSIVCIHLPTGQATWHIHDSERPLFTHLAMGENHWDGHDDPEKWRRVAALAASPSPGAVEAAYREGYGDGRYDELHGKSRAASYVTERWQFSAARRGAAGGQDG